MQRCSLPHAHVTPAFLIIFIYLCLQDHTHAFHEEDAAKNRNHQLLMDHHGADTDDAADGQTARIAKEHLCRRPPPKRRREREKSPRRRQKNGLLGPPRTATPPRTTCSKGSPTPPSPPKRPSAARRKSTRNGTCYSRRSRRKGPRN